MSRYRSFLSFALVTFLFALAAERCAAEVTAEKGDGKVTIKIDGDLFTEYVANSNGKPILWPIVGPTGALMTRSYPMAKVAGEKTDHPHQRSFWFTHGDVNGVDFWMEGAKAGKQVHKEFVRVEGGQKAIVVTRNDWVAPDGKRLLQDERQVAFFPLGESRVIDFDITLTASDGPVTFGDTKEGSFGLRIAESMRVDVKRGGRIINSEGQADDERTLQKAQTWGKRAAWVDYSGPVQDRQDKESLAGITILNHPSSFRYPTHWHVRTYGLFAANPFGIHDFEPGAPKGAGEHRLENGESIRFRYRVIFHKGAADPDHLKRLFEDYSLQGEPTR